MANPRTIVNSLSLSRIELALLFVVCFQRKAGFLYASGVLWVVSLTTDLLDGYLARRWQVDSPYGRFWDSLGDKSFYAAGIIAFNAQGFLSPLLSWALIAREVALYVTRIIFSEKLPKIEQIRPWTDSHGIFMHLTIALGLLRRDKSVKLGAKNKRLKAAQPHIPASRAPMAADGQMTLP